MGAKMKNLADGLEKIINHELIYGNIQDYRYRSVEYWAKDLATSIANALVVCKTCKGLGKSLKTKFHKNVVRKLDVKKCQICKGKGIVIEEEKEK